MRILTWAVALADHAPYFKFWICIQSNEPNTYLKLKIFCWVDQASSLRQDTEKVKIITFTHPQKILIHAGKMETF